MKNLLFWSINLLFWSTIVLVVGLVYWSEPGAAWLLVVTMSITALVMAEL